MQEGAGLSMGSAGTANLEGCNIFDNGAYVLTFSPFPVLSSSAPLERFVCSRFAQHAGGLYIDGGGTATLIDTNVYSNRASGVSLH